jgi:hypothetical protein
MKLRRNAVVIGLIWFSCFIWFPSSGSAGGDQVQYFPHLAFGGGYDSIWQFTGLGAGTATVTVEFFAQNGLPLIVPTDAGTSSIFRFTLDGSASESFRSLGSGTQASIGWAKVTSSQPIGATETFRLAPGDGGVICQAAVLPSKPVGAVTVLAPDPRNAAIALVNVGLVSSTYDFRLIDKNGNMAATGSRILGPANQAALYVNQISGLEGVGVRDGSLEVTASESFVLVALAFEGRNFTTSPVQRGRMPTASDRAGLLDAILALKQGLDAALDEFLGPDPADVVPYAAFLLQSDTGMTRLVPRETYDHVLPIVGGGAYYSFYRLTHEYGYGSDLSLEQGRLKVGFAGYDFGFLTDLGNVPVDQVAVDHPGLQYLHSYVPPSVDADIRAEQQRAGLGFTVGPYYYRSSLPAKLDTTYVLRSMNYLESDLLVVFRIVRIDSDGSVILVWRKLATYPVPHYQ